ncbi:MAG: hypothetical protein IT376_21570 [Polyangiaceae bacterium]|nr:hypothetical protein [Polyangiaceae bacterium]
MQLAPSPGLRRLLATAAAAGLVVGCGPKKDAAKCQEAQVTVKKALEGAQFAEARQWRDHAYKQCADTTALAELDRSIVTREGEVQAATAREAQAKPLMELFARFVAENATTAERAVAAKTCPEEGKPDYGFCAGERAIGGTSSAIQVRYKADAVGAFRYTVQGAGAGTCAQLGGQQGRKWSVTTKAGGKAHRAHCKLSGLDAVLSVEDAGTTVTLASPSYLAVDPFLKRQIEQEGK